MDDFAVSVTQPDGTHRTFRTFGTNIKVDIHDPLAPHKELLRVYTDADIHNVTAYLASLAEQMMRKLIRIRVRGRNGDARCRRRA